MPKVAASDSGSTMSQRRQPATWQAVHDRGEPLVQLARPFAALENGGIDARVEIEQQPLELAPPVVTRFGKQVRHALRTPGTGSRPVLVRFGQRDLAEPAANAANDVSVTV